MFKEFNLSKQSFIIILLLLSCLLLTGCSQETLFRSNFDNTAVNDPPAAVQEIGTIKIDGPAGAVKVIAPPVTPSGKWVQITRLSQPQTVSGMQCNFSKFVGDGEYTFSSTLFMPSRSGIATIQFEAFNQAVSDLNAFLHLDFTEDNRVRLDDNDATKFGSFQRDQPFIVQVILKITSATPTAHITLSGAGGSGETDYTILGPFRPMAHQFGAVRLWMGFPQTGSFDATTIAVTHKTN